MFIDFTPSLSDDDAESLELELGSIANELGIEGIEIARWGDDGDEVLKSLELFYEEGQDDDDQLFKYGEEILSEFERYQASGGLLKEFGAVLKRVGRFTLKLVRE